MASMLYICKEWPNKYKPTWDWQIQALLESGVDVTVMQTSVQKSGKINIPGTPLEVKRLWYPSSVRDVMNFTGILYLVISMKWLRLKRLKLLFGREDFKSNLNFFVRSLFITEDFSGILFFKNLSTTHDFLFIDDFYKNAKKVMYYHGGATANVKAHYMSTRERVFGWLDVIFTNTNYSKSEVVALGADANKVKTLFVGLDLEQFPFFDRTYKPENELRLLSVCRVSYEKGLIYVLKALVAFIDRSEGRVRYDIVGDGEELQKLKRFALNNGLQNIVFFHGHQGNAIVRGHFLPNADVFVNTCFPTENWAETQCVAIQEANLLGIPAIASNCGGLPEVVIDGCTGLLVRIKSAEDILAAILFFNKRSDNELAAMGARARAFVKQHFDVVSMTKAILVEIDRI